jgi:hypothetical protein
LERNNAEFSFLLELGQIHDNSRRTLRERASQTWTYILLEINLSPIFLIDHFYYISLHIILFRTLHNSHDNPTNMAPSSTDGSEIAYILDALALLGEVKPDWTALAAQKGISHRNGAYENQDLPSFYTDLC